MQHRPNSGKPIQNHSSGNSNHHSSATRGNSNRPAAGYSSAHKNSYNSASKQRHSRNAENTMQLSGRRRTTEKRAEGFDFRSLRPALIIVIVALLAFGIYLGSAWLTVTSNKGTFCENLSINGINLNKLSYQEGVDAVHEQIDSLLNAAYTLTWNDRSWSFSASDFGAQMNADDLLDRAWNIGHYGGLMDRSNAIRSLKNESFAWSSEMTYNDDLVCDFIDKIYDEVYLEPVNAEVTVAEDRPYMTGQSSTGLALNKQVTHDQIISLITEGQGNTALQVDVIQPAISSDDAMGGLELIVDFTTDISFRGWHSRFNVRKALESFNGLCVFPGDTISFNEIVGMRTEANGWQKAPEYAGGTTTQGFGGGVCQASSTLYNALMKAGMTIITRYPHSMTVTYLEPSLDAAVTNTNKNMVFRNDTEYAIYIYAKVDRTTANVKIYGNRPAFRYELESVIISQAADCTRKDYVYDTEGKYVYYTTDPPVLYSAGHPALVSESYILSYDWNTGELMNRVQVSHDNYASGTNIYWRGVHNADGSVIKTD